MKVSLAASRCRTMVAARGDTAAEAANLAELAVAVGFDLEERRATGFTGLLILGRDDLLLDLKTGKRPLRIELRSDSRPMPRA